MNLLGAIHYDPSTAVNKVCTAALAMTALDTTNLRIAFTIPAHGKVKVRLHGTLHGATTFPQILLGVLEGSTVRMRMAPMTGGGNLAATTIQAVEAETILSGLTPGAVNWDAAYGVETLVSSTGLKYGGPNNTTANDAWGAFVFEVWDPIPLPTAAPGAANGLHINGANAGTTTYGAMTITGAMTVNGVANVSQTGDNFARIGAAGGGLTSVGLAASQHVIVDSGTVTTLSNLPAIPANWITATGITAAALNGKGDWNIGKTGYSLTQAFPANFSALSLTAGGLVTLAAATHTGAVIPTVSAVTGLTASNLDAAVSSRSTYAGGAVASVSAAVTVGTNNDKTGYALSTAGVQAVWDALTSALTTVGSIGKKFADWVVGTAQTGDSYARIGAAGAGLTAVGDARMANLDAAVSSRSVYAGGAVASVTGAVGSVTGLTASDVGAIKTKTDQLAFTSANKVDANVKAVNSVTVNGAGSSGSPWGP